MKSFGKPLLLLGGGGYTIRNVARCWTYETSVALDATVDDELPYNDYYEYFGPDFRLQISPTNMDNQNTPEYLQKCLERLIENLRHVQHAPGIQSTTLESAAISAEATAAAAEAAEDPDVKESEAQADARIVKDNEIDDENAASGDRDISTSNSKDPESKGPAAVVASNATVPEPSSTDAKAVSVEKDAPAAMDVETTNLPDAAGPNNTSQSMATDDDASKDVSAPVAEAAPTPKDAAEVAPAAVTAPTSGIEPAPMET